MSHDKFSKTSKTYVPYVYVQQRCMETISLLCLSHEPSTTF